MLIIVVVCYKLILVKEIFITERIQKNFVLLKLFQIDFALVLKKRCFNLMKMYLMSILNCYNNHYIYIAFEGN